MLNINLFDLLSHLPLSFHGTDHSSGAVTLSCQPASDFIAPIYLIALWFFHSIVYQHSLHSKMGSRVKGLFNKTSHWEIKEWVHSMSVSLCSIICRC